MVDSQPECVETAGHSSRVGAQLIATEYVDRCRRTVPHRRVTVQTYRHRHVDRQTHRQTDRHMDRCRGAMPHRHRHVDRHANRHTDRQTDRHVDRRRGRHRQMQRHGARLTSERTNLQTRGHRAVGCHYFPPGLQLPSQPVRAMLPISLLGEQRHDGCEQFA